MATTNTEIKNLQQLRKVLKEMGYKVKTKSMSWGRHVTYGHIESGDWLTYNIFTKETFDRWRPLMEWLESNADVLLELKKSEGLYGLQRST